MSKLSRLKLKFERLPSEDRKMFLKNISAYANIGIPLIKKREPMKKKNTSPKKTSTKKTDYRAADTVLTVASQAVLAFYALEKLMTVENLVVRYVLGFAVAYSTLTIGHWAYNNVIRPAARAIVENQK